MSESIELTENQKAWMRLETLMSVMERARNLELAKSGLNIPQASVLYCLKIVQGAADTHEAVANDA